MGFLNDSYVQLCLIYDGAVETCSTRYFVSVCATVRVESEVYIERVCSEKCNILNVVD